MATQDVELVQLVRKFLQKVRNSGIRVEKAFLFGSRATGGANIHSDIDIAVVSPDFSGDHFEDMGKLTRLTWDIDVRMEPIGFRPEDFNEDDPLAYEIINHGKEIRVPNHSKNLK